ncbi:unnamed protein product [Penicillium egyptiacum]|uniref:Uncharacterized protein n=1 Tax=Penicillium egyptiacum TaxID=1303716 RepID=A0A9W4KIQ3_9EURO|nr:unnamed protein product [Penicillium egyptiacum]
MQAKIRQYRADPLKVRNGQIKRLLRELIAHIDRVDTTLPGLRIRSRRPSPSLASQSQHTIPGHSSVDMYSQPPSTKHSDQELIAIGKYAAMRCDFVEAKSRLLQISNKAVLERQLKELDRARQAQIQTKKDFER